MEPPDFFATMKSHKDFLKTSETRETKKRNSFFIKNQKKRTQYSPEEDILADQELLKEIETCQKIRVKILLELYKQMEESPAEIWRVPPKKKKGVSSTTTK